MATFSEVVDAADNLTVEEQQTLLEILNRRLADRNREILVREVEEARSEFADGQVRTTSAKDIVDETRSES